MDGNFGLNLIFKGTNGDPDVAENMFVSILSAGN